MLNNGMKFKNWLQLNEMPHFSMDGSMSIPCQMIKAAAGGIEMPCVPGKKIGMIDMRFEDYPPPFNKITPFDKFVGAVPGSSEYLVYDGGAKLMFGTELKKLGMLAERPGMRSEKGFMLIPDDWFVHAMLIDTDYEVIKPPLSVANGKRTG